MTGTPIRYLTEIFNAGRRIAVHVHDSAPMAWRDAYETGMRGYEGIPAYRIGADWRAIRPDEPVPEVQA